MASIKRVPTERTRQEARNVAKMRRELGLTLTEFGAIADVTAPTVSNRENEDSTSEPNISEYRLLIAAYELSLEEHRKQDSGINFSSYSISSIINFVKGLSSKDQDEVIMALNSKELDQ